MSRGVGRPKTQLVGGGVNPILGFWDWRLKNIRTASIFINRKLRSQSFSSDSQDSMLSPSATSVANTSRSGLRTTFLALSSDFGTR